MPRLSKETWEQVINVFSLVYTGTQTSRIYDYLYQYSTVYLERKKDKFNLLLSK